MVWRSPVKNVLNKDVFEKFKNNNKCFPFKKVGLKTSSPIFLSVASGFVKDSPSNPNATKATTSVVYLAHN